MSNSVAKLSGINYQHNSHGWRVLITEKPKTLVMTDKTSYSLVKNKTKKGASNGRR